MSLISFRYRRAWGPAIGLSPQQLELVAQVRSSLDDGTYRMQPTRCVCGSREAEPISQIDRYGIGLTTVMCAGCATLRFDPYLDAPSLAHFYTRRYQQMYGRVPDPAGYYLRQRGYGQRLLEAVAGALPPRARVLEVGCGAGGALAVFEQAGHQVFGCDYSAELIDYGRAQGRAALGVGDLNDAARCFELRDLDLIFLHHVFEHLLDPVAWLRTAEPLLAERGVIVIAVPDVAEIDNYESPGGDLRQFLHIAHTYNFTMQGLERAAAGAGLSAAAISVTRSTAAPEIWVAFGRGPIDALGAGAVWRGSSAQLRERLRTIERRHLLRRAAGKLGRLLHLGGR